SIAEGGQSRRAAGRRSERVCERPGGARLRLCRGQGAGRRVVLRNQGGPAPRSPASRARAPGARRRPCARLAAGNLDEPGRVKVPEFT
ncbi:unnamed protein product, partial [Gulo gulo]